MWFTPKSFNPVCFPSVSIGDVTLQHVSIQLYLLMKILLGQLKSLMLADSYLIIYSGLIQSTIFILICD